MADLFDGYPLGDVWDEMFGEAGRAGVLRRVVRLDATDRR
jgi:hypothetical protein